MEIEHEEYKFLGSINFRKKTFPLVAERPFSVVLNVSSAAEWLGREGTF